MLLNKSIFNPFYGDGIYNGCLNGNGSGDGIGTYGGNGMEDSFGHIFQRGNGFSDTNAFLLKEFKCLY